MKIVYVYPILASLAGTERVLTDKMNYLADNAGYEVYLLTYEQGNHRPSFPLSSKIRHVDLDVRFFPLYKYNRFARWYKELTQRRLLRKKFNDFIREISPDIVIASTYFVEAISIIAECPGNFVRILESHIDKRYILANDPVNNRGLFKRVRASIELYLETRYSRRFDLLVALSQHDADDWSKYLKTTVIPNVVHLQKTGVYSQLVNKRVVFAGRFMEQKGIFDLLKIWEMVHGQHPDWYLDLYGEGKLREQFVLKATQQQINIRVHEPTDDILKEFCESSIFVLTSLYEPFGLVLVEAMSCGLPVVSFDCPYGPSSIIHDGEDGFLIPNRDMSLFVKRLCELMESSELREKMGRKGIQSSKRYSQEEIMPKWINLFNNLIEK